MKEFIKAISYVGLVIFSITGLVGLGMFCRDEGASFLFVSIVALFLCWKGLKATYDG